MAKKEITVLACRIFALFAFLQFISKVEETIGVFCGSMTTSSEFHNEAKILAVAFLVSAVLILVLAILIWLKAEWLADKILPNADSTKSEIEISLADVQVLAFSIVGLVLIVHALPYIGGLIADYIMTTSKSLRHHSLSYYRLGTQYGIEFVLGVGLFWGAKGLAGIWKSLRRS